MGKMSFIFKAVKRQKSQNKEVGPPQTIVNLFHMCHVFKHLVWGSGSKKQKQVPTATD